MRRSARVVPPCTSLYDSRSGSKELDLDNHHAEVLLADRVRCLRAVILVQDQAWLHWRLFLLEELSMDGLELFNQIGGMRIQMELDALC